MEKVEEWLENNYPKEKRDKITNLDVSGRTRNNISYLKLEGFVNLKSLNCSNTSLMSLDLTGLIQLEELICSNNYLTNIDFSSLDSEKITLLDLENNDLTPKSLEIFSTFTNLKRLVISNPTEEKPQTARYFGGGIKWNRFYGSLEPLKNLTKLEYLDISATDVGTGLEHLNLDILFLVCDTSKGRKTKVEKIHDSYIKWQSSEKEQDIQQNQPYKWEKLSKELKEQLFQKEQQIQTLEIENNYLRSQLNKTKELVNQQEQIAQIIHNPPRSN